MGITRKIIGWLPIAGILLAGLAVFEWVDYHTKGSTPLLGINPRCIASSFGHCFSLDTSIMSWDATLATWLARGGWYLMLLGGIVAGVIILAGAIAGIVLLAQVAATPRQERLSRLADNRRLSLITFGLLGLPLIGLVAALMWAQLEIIAALLITETLAHGPDR